jgi:Anti-sigma-K factor rskA
VSDPHHPDHVSDELPGLLAGESDRATTFQVAAHLRVCPECTDDLITIAAVTGALRFAERAERTLNPTPAPSLSPVLAPTVDLGPEPDEIPKKVAVIVRADHARKWRQRVTAAAAAVILLVVGGLIGTQLDRTNTPHTSVSVQARLQPVHAPPGVGGRIQVAATGATRQLEVHTAGLPAAPPNHYYEVWVFNPATLKMLPMGVLGPSGQGQYQIAAPIMAGYSAVDISLQTNDGNPAHSNVSVLRAYL